MSKGTEGDTNIKPKEWVELTEWGETVRERREGKNGDETNIKRKEWGETVRERRGEKTGTRQILKKRMGRD